MTGDSSAANWPSCTRRSFLRGAGVALALPWLESLPIRAEELGKRTSPDESQPPVRFACLYFSNGVEPEHWWAKGSGRAMEVPSRYLSS